MAECPKSQGVRGQRIPLTQRAIDEQQSTFLSFASHHTLVMAIKQEECKCAARPVRRVRACQALMGIFHI
jgi:hypothetical protein